MKFKNNIKKEKEIEKKNADCIGMRNYYTKIKVYFNLPSSTLKLRK